MKDDVLLEKYNIAAEDIVLSPNEEEKQPTPDKTDGKKKKVYFKTFYWSIYSN